MEDEFERLRFDILGITESRWTGEGKIITTQGNCLIYSGNEERHEGGIAILIKKRHKQSIMEWDAVSERII